MQKPKEAGFRGPMQRGACFGDKPAQGKLESAALLALCLHTFEGVLSCHPLGQFLSFLSLQWLRKIHFPRAKQ